MTLPLKPNEDKPSLSPSAIRKALSCMEAFRLRYIEGVRETRSTFAAVGSAAHTAFHRDSQKKILTGNRLSKEALRSEYSDAYDKEVTDGQTQVTEDVKRETGEDDEKKAIGKLKDHGIGVVDLFHDKVSETIVPIASEQKFRVELDGGFDIVGFIDVITVRDEVGDYKVVGRFGNVADWVEAPYYALGFASMNEGKLPRSLFLQYLKRDKEETKRAPVTISAKEVEGALMVAEQLEQAIESEVFLPTGRGSWQCSPKYCSFYPCRFIGK